MISVKELKSWISTVNDKNSVAIDDGGLTIVEIDQDGKETGYYLELGGVPNSVFGDE